MRINSNIRAGQAYCPEPSGQGIVEKSDGFGYYGAIRGQDGLLHFFNRSYTTFLPNDQGVGVGQSVTYTPFVPPHPWAGKAHCVNSAPVVGAQNSASSG